MNKNMFLEHMHPACPEFEVNMATTAISENSVLQIQPTEL